MTHQHIANASAIIAMLLFCLLFYKAFRYVMHERKQPPEDKGGDPIYGVADSSKFIEAEFVMRKDDRLIFQKDGQLFAVGLSERFTQKFTKGKTYKIGKSENGLITILT